MWPPGNRTVPRQQGAHAGAPLQGNDPFIPAGQWGPLLVFPTAVRGASHCRQIGRA
jgi:hypothetical protein